MAGRASNDHIGDMIDFRNAYVTWSARPTASTARCEIEAACTLVDEVAGTSENFYLMTPCRSEHMYRDDQVFSMPNYLVSMIWSARELVFIRTHWVTERDHFEYRAQGESIHDVRLNVPTFAQARVLPDARQITAATLQNLPLNARTELWDDARQLRAILEYPVKTMNFAADPPRFQVDTGPLLLPDFSSAAEHPIERFNLAHVGYSVFDKAEFILHKPVPIPDGERPLTWTTDYSQVQVLPARNEILCGVSAQS